MGRVEARLWIKYILTILNQIDWFTVSHSISLYKVGRRLVNDIIMTNYFLYLRTKDLRGVPVRAIKISRWTTEDSFNRSRHFPVLLLGIEYIRKTAIGIIRFLMIVDVFVLKLCQCILCLTSFHKREQFTKSLSCLLSIFLIIIISLAILAGTCLRTILHQRTSSPKIGFTKITKSHDLIDAKIILTLCGSTCRSLIPINRQQIGSLAEICCRFISAFLIRKAWQIQLGIGIEISIHIRHTTKILHHFLMPPCTEEIELTLYQFFLFSTSSHKLVDIL